MLGFKFCYHSLRRSRNLISQNERRLIKLIGALIMGKWLVGLKPDAVVRWCLGKEQWWHIGGLDCKEKLMKRLQCCPFCKKQIILRKKVGNISVMGLFTFQRWSFVLICLWVTTTTTTTTTTAAAAFSSSPPFFATYHSKKRLQEWFISFVCLLLIVGCFIGWWKDDDCVSEFYFSSNVSMHRIL